MAELSRLFVELNDEHALDLLLRSERELLRSVEAGSQYINDEFAMANQYVMAAHLLRDAALRSGTPWFYAHPLLFLYRHAIELHLKAILRPPRPTHSLAELTASLRAYVRDRYNVDITGWVTDTLDEFARVDPTSTGFRYANDNKGRPSFPAEQVVDVDELKARLDRLFQILTCLHYAQRKPTAPPATPDDLTS